MYNPSEIENFELLSSYLRTTPEQLNQFVNGKCYIIDWNDDASLRELAASKDETFKTDFHRFHIPKRNKKLGTRTVYKCYQQFTRDILKTLKFNLEELYEPLDCVHGFVRKRNTRSNAIAHTGNRFLLSLDIRNFFESINKKSVMGAFISLGFKESIASDLSTICTLEDHLVQGFSTSPIIANIVCKEIDLKLQNICELNEAIYTRYADDISISGDGNLPELKEIENVIQPFGFELNHPKTKRFKKGQNQYVTGLSISDSSYPRIPKPIKKRLRQQFYFIKKFGYTSHICKINEWDEETESSFAKEEVRKTRNQLKGWIDYIHSVEPDLAIKYYNEFNEIEKSEYGYDRKELNELLREGNITKIKRPPE